MTYILKSALVFGLAGYAGMLAANLCFVWWLTCFVVFTLISRKHPVLILGWFVIYMPIAFYGPGLLGSKWPRWSRLGFFSPAPAKEGKCKPSI